MTGDELRDAVAQRRARRRDDVAFRAAGVGDEGGRVEKRRDAREQRTGLRDGRGEQHEVGATERTFERAVIVEGSRRVDHAEFERTLDRLGRTPDTHDFAR